MTVQPDTKRIVRQWDREIEEETRRLAAQADPGPWRGVLWATIWIMWLMLLGGLLSAIRIHG